MACGGKRKRYQWRCDPCQKAVRDKARVKREWMKVGVVEPPRTEDLPGGAIVVGIREKVHVPEFVEDEPW